MDLTQLEYFRTVAKYENVTRAAKELYVAQPTLSQSISRLEDSLGVALFDRKGGKLYLNDAGHMFLARVDSCFAELDAGLVELEQYKEKHQLWVYVASSVIDVFKVIITDYLKVQPDVRIDHRLVYDGDIMDFLMQNKVDFAITPDPISDPHVRCVPLCEDEVFAVVGDCHPLGQEQEITLDALRQYPLICNSGDADISFVERLFHAEHHSLNIIASSNESHIPKELTEAGLCVGFLPSRVAVKHLKNPGNGQHVLRITPTISRTCCISTKTSHLLSKQASDLYDYIVQYFRSESQAVAEYLGAYYKKP